MELAELHGPIDLTRETITSLEHLVGCAIYVLGQACPDSAFVAMRVGQTDTNISVHLDQYQRKYQCFCYLACSSTEEAYTAVCRLYHTLLPPDNVVHPVRPNGLVAACPVCGRDNKYRAVARTGDTLDAVKTPAE